jgi:acetyltransferase-like isoleucine patch superfamily enzyme
LNEKTEEHYTAKMLEELRLLVQRLQADKIRLFNRRVSVGDLLTDRHQNAREYGWGEGTTCYDNVLVLGDVKVGDHTWIGPNVILDGRGKLEIGSYCSISAGVHIYTHHTVRWSLSSGQIPMEKAPTKIGSSVYIGPNSVVSKGVTVGDGVVIGALSFVNCDIPSGMKAFGRPARIVGAATDACDEPVAF